jgi:hypothetical protein
MEKKVYWKTRENKILDVDMMSDLHVRNAFKMLLTKYNLGATTEEVNAVVNTFLKSITPDEVFGYRSDYNYIHE